MVAATSAPASASQWRGAVCGVCACTAILVLYVTSPRAPPPPPQHLATQALVRALCPAALKPPPSRIGSCPHSPWVTVRMSAGRTGSHLSAYASLWLYAREHSGEQEPLQPSCLSTALSPILERQSLPILKTKGCVIRWPVHVLPSNRLDHRALAEHLTALRQELRLTPRLRQYAQEHLRVAAEKLGLGDAVWWISVHARRTDYGAYLRRALNASAAPLTWYVRAVQEHLHRAPPKRPRALLLLSDDTKWVRGVLAPTLRQLTASVVEGEARTAGRALALLSQASSSVVAQGSFGAWGALLAGGNTTVYPLSARAVTLRLASALPNWSVLP